MFDFGTAHLPKAFTFEFAKLQNVENTFSSSIMLKQFMKNICLKTHFYESTTFPKLGP